MQKRIALFAVLSTLIALTASAATLVAKVTLKTAPPAARVINTNADPYCATAHKTQKLTSEEVVPNPDGTLKNVMVWVREGISGNFQPPKTPIVLDQQGCHYVPHVVAMMAGQPILIRNSDNTLHNIHPLPKVNTPFNIGMPTRGMQQEKVFAKAENPFHVKCDVHPWMSGFIGVFDHPFFGVSNDKGVVEIANLPAGTYTIESWHEKYGAKFQKVTVAASDRKEIDFTY